MKKASLAVLLSVIAACNQAPIPPANLKADISSPSRDLYAKGDVSVQVIITGGKPDTVQLLKNGTPLVELVPPYSYVWDTRNEAEGSYELVARAVLGGKNIDSPIRKIVVDRTPPALEGHTPEDNSDNVWHREPITAKFSEPLLPSSLSKANIRLLGEPQRENRSALAANVLGEFKLSDDGKTLAIHHSEQYLGQQGYYLLLGDPRLPQPPLVTKTTAVPPITDLAGNPLSDSFWSWYMPEWHQVGNTTLDQDPNSAVVSAVKLDRAGNPVVAWFEFGKGIFEILVKRWDGKAWVRLGDALNIGSNIEAHYLSLVLDAAANPVAVWTEVSKESGSRVYVKRWNSGKNNWEQLGQSLGSGETTWAEQGSIILDKSGSPVVAFVESQEKAPAQLMIKRWNGKAWELLGDNQPLNITDKFSATRPSIATDKPGNLYVAWTEGFPYVKKLVGKEWVSLGDALSEKPEYVSTSASIAIDSQNRPVVAWAERDFPEVGPPTSSTVVLKRWEGTAWVGLLTTSNACLAPSLAIDKTDAAVVACKGLASERVYLYKSGQSSAKPFSSIPAGPDWPLPYSDWPVGLLALDETGQPTVALSGGPALTGLDLKVLRWNGKIESLN